MQTLLNVYLVVVGECCFMFERCSFAQGKLYYEMLTLETSEARKGPSFMSVTEFAGGDISTMSITVKCPL